MAIGWELDAGVVLRGVHANGASVFFAGDSAGTRFPPGLAPSGVDVAVMGIGGYNPFSRSHATPEKVWEMSRELGSRYLFPVHWGTKGFSLNVNVQSDSHDFEINQANMELSKDRANTLFMRKQD